MLTSLIVTVVDLSRRFALLVVLAALVAAGGLGWYAATHFKINTDINQLLSSDLDWRQREAELEKAFPQKTDLLLVVVDGETPEAAETAAAALAERLRAMPDKFSFVERPDAIPFFRKNGLLFLSKEKLSGILDQMIQAQPMLGMLASDPSLRGFFSTIGLMLQGLQHGATDFGRLEQPLTQIAETTEAALIKQDKPLALQSMGGGEKPALRDLRKFIVTKPVLDYSALEPGEAARATIRTLARDMADHICATSDMKSSSLDALPVFCPRVRMTGPVALNDEEFASVADSTGLATIVSGILVFALLFAALRSLRIILPILLTLGVGLVTTTAFALAAIGSLNLISVAFAVMFIGIAVDFGIQFGVRYRDQHHLEPDHAKAMTRTAREIAVPLAMAAGSTALGFLAFIPTAYRGVAELGLIAGVGMVIAFMLNITLLPALLALTRPPAEPESVGYRWAAPVDGFLTRRRRVILAAAFGAALIGGAIATHLHFDFDPLDLKDARTESVSTLLDLMHDPDFSSYTMEVLRPSLKGAQELAETAGKLPEVDHVMTLASFVPEDQDAKLAMIADTRMLLEPTLNLPPVGAPPSDEEILGGLRKAVDLLHALGGQYPVAARLAKALEVVLTHPDHELLQRLHKNLVGVMQAQFDAMKQSLGAGRVSAETITDDLRRDWVTPDGRFLVQVYPKGDPRNHKTLAHFADAVRRIAPDAAGAPVSIRESGHTVTGAFVHAGVYALIAIGLLALLLLRRISDVLLLLTPLVLAGILTLATMALIGLPLNFANIIALPLLLSLGVSYAVYFVSYARAGSSGPLQSSMARAVLFSAATVLVAFGSLALSPHPGTASMGVLLVIALLYALLCTFFVLPALSVRLSSKSPA